MEYKTRLVDAPQLSNKSTKKTSSPITHPYVIKFFFLWDFRLGFTGKIHTLHIVLPFFSTCSKTSTILCLPYRIVVENPSVRWEQVERFWRQWMGWLDVFLGCVFMVICVALYYAKGERWVISAGYWREGVGGMDCLSLLEQKCWLAWSNFRNPPGTFLKPTSFDSDHWLPLPSLLPLS